MTTTPTVAPEADTAPAAQQNPAAPAAPAAQGQADAAPADAPTAARPAPRGPRLPRVTDEEIEACRTADGLVKALGILGLINAAGDTVHCPTCGKPADLKKFSIKPDGGFKHFGSDGCWGGKGAGIGLLTAPPLTLSFPDAVRAIVGKPTSVPVTVPDELPHISVRSFKARLDHEVYGGVLAYGRKAFGGEGVIAAQEHYAQWHIHPEVVARSGAVYITRPDHFATAILERFGIERLLACGLFVMVPGRNGAEDKPLCLVGKKWPLIEPARDADGRVVNMQFRASNAQYAKYLAHKAGRLPYEGNQKFINVRGADPIAVNLDTIARLPEGSDVYVVEGFKDRLAAATLGLNAVGFPGTGYRPHPAELEVLRRHNVILAFDGDDAGQRAMNGETVKAEDGTVTMVKQGMIDYLREHGVDRVQTHPLTDDMDITDRLVEKFTVAGCACTECKKMRSRLGRG